MPLVKAQCTNCGAALEVDNSKEAAVCPFCNTPYIVEKAINNYTTNVTNNINAQTVNIINQKEDFEIVAGVLKKYNGEATDIIVPDNVISINPDAFPKTVTSVVLGSGITTIEQSLFRSCDKLTSVTIPDTVKSIGGYSFDGCENLKSIVLPEGITTIGEGAFRGCSGITSVTIPDTVKSIGGYSFDGCENLKSIVLPEGITTIGEGAFRGCSGITSIIIPDKVKTVGRCAFANCTLLKSAQLPASITELDYTFLGCTNLESVVFTNSSNQSGQTNTDYLSRARATGFYEIRRLIGTFKDCSSLKSIVIPSTISGLDAEIVGRFRESGAGVFKNCSSLEKIHIENEGLFSIDANSFVNCHNLKEITAKNPNMVSFKKYDISGANGVKYLKSINVESNQPIQTNISINKSEPGSTKSGGCYVATCVYGSYDCPQVWTLRRYRDDMLGSTWYGRAFIRVYYAISPTLVKWFGKTKWFKKMWQGKLDRMVKKLNAEGIENTPYIDKQW